jgi:hypothetical protein
MHHREVIAPLLELVKFLIQTSFNAGVSIDFLPPRQKRCIWTTDEVVDPLLEVARPRHLWSN